MISNENLVVIGLVVQIFLAVFALWYTVETRSLRRHSMKQLAVLQRQHIVAVAPFLLIGLLPKTELIEKLESAPEKVLDAPPDQIQDMANKEIQRLRTHDGNLYFCNVSNPTSKIALQVDAFVYDSTTKNFATSSSSIAVIAEKDDAQLIVGVGPLSKQEVIEAASEEYPEISKRAGELLDYQNRSYLLVLFRDIEQGAYAIKREYEVDEDGESGMFTSKLYTL